MLSSPGASTLHGATLASFTRRWHLDPINNIDRLVFVLRQRLQERARLTSKSGAANSQARSASAAPLGLEGLAAIQGLDERQLRRALIQNIMAEQFGQDMINDAQFQEVVDKVSDAIQGDANSAAVMDQALNELRLSTS